ncbi:MAG: protein-export chaperone SecB [Rhodospirillales bacterium]|nr:protein-export chaperone SecB [Rhodospirillales bacterium]
MPVTIQSQYIKDLSFENPGAPETLMALVGSKPEMDINFTMDARQLKEMGDNLYEVVLGVTVTAKSDVKTLFIAEVMYGLTCTLNNIAEQKKHPLLLIEMPRYMFPFVRQIIADMTQSAGYAPLLLSPVDFRRFYVNRFGQAAPKSDDEQGLSIKEAADA